MMRRALMMAAVLVAPVLLALGGSLLAAPAGPPDVDAKPVKLGSVTGAPPVPALEPEQGPSPAPSPAPPITPAPTPAPPVTPTPGLPAPAPAPESPAAPGPAPVVPPVVIDDDDVEDGDD
ncbi:hypothetical protein M1D88_16800 [Arthrobacter sp. R1-13]